MATDNTSNSKGTDAVVQSTQQLNNYTELTKKLFESILLFRLNFFYKINNFNMLNNLKIFLDFYWFNIW